MWELRKRNKVINNSEFKDPCSDEYVFCNKCVTFVYKYCSIHGSELVIPDSKVKNDLPSIPRAAITIPSVFLHLARSGIPGAGIGVFSTMTLPPGVRFGPYQGIRAKEVHSAYCWQINDKNKKASHVIDASDANRSNWMRYVNCARHWCEQNLIAYQYQGQIYYSTIKTIPKYTELLVFYGSEFANILNINLRQYNDDRTYREVVDKNCEESKGLLKHEEEALSLDEERENISYDETTDTVYKNTQPTALKTKTNHSIPQFFSVPELDNHKPNSVPVSCNLVYTNNDAEHINISNDSTCFRCDICGKCVKFKRYLQRHKLIHVQDKSYACDVCGKTFALKSYLRTHKFTHVYNIFPCDLCDKTFTVKRNLMKHKLIHSRNLYKNACNI